MIGTLEGPDGLEGRIKTSLSRRYGFVTSYIHKFSPQIVNFWVFYVFIWFYHPSSDFSANPTLWSRVGQKVFKAWIGFRE